MRFSIITATKNSESFLMRNIDSVKNQTFQDFEHIFIDGNSTDNTIKIIKKYQNEFPGKVKLYQFPPQGISHAMNKGIEKSNGEFINHLHADDSFYDEKVLEDTNNFLEKNGNLDWIYGLANVIEKDGESIHIYPNKPWLHYHDYTSFWGRYVMKLTTFIPHQSVFINRTVFEKYGLFDESLSSGMDPEMWMRIRNKTKWSFYKRIICNYRIHENAQSSSKQNKRENQGELLKVQKRYLNFIELPLARLIHFIKSRRRIDHR